MTNCFGSNYYIPYLVLACSLSVAGLISDSKALVIGSMLVAPLFVPIINGGKSQSLIVLGSFVFCLLFGYVSSKVFKLHKETFEMRSLALWDVTSLNVTVVNYIIPLLCGIIIALANKSSNIVCMVLVSPFRFFHR